MNKERIPEYDRIIAHEEDIADSRISPRLNSGETFREISGDIVDEVQYFLDHYDVTSGEQLTSILERLDAAIATSNDPNAKEVLRSLKSRFHAEAF